MAKMQKFPIYYPGEQLCQGDNVPNGSPQRGAEAIVQTAITTRRIWRPRRAETVCCCLAS